MYCEKYGFVSFHFYFQLPWAIFTRKCNYWVYQRVVEFIYYLILCQKDITWNISTYTYIYCIAFILKILRKYLLFISCISTHGISYVLKWLKNSISYLVALFPTVWYFFFMHSPKIVFRYPPLDWPSDVRMEMSFNYPDLIHLMEGRVVRYIFGWLLLSEWNEHLVMGRR